MSFEITLNLFYREILAVMTRDFKDLIDIEKSLAEINEPQKDQAIQLENIELTDDLILAHIRGLCIQTSLDIQAEKEEEKKLFCLKLAVATLRVIFSIVENWEYELFENKKNLTFPIKFGDEFFNLEIHSIISNSIFRSVILKNNNYYLFKANSA
jgi:hypothetical protein